MPYIRRYRLRKPLYRRRRIGRRMPLYAAPSRTRRAKLPSTTFSESYRLATVLNNNTTGFTADIWKVRLMDIPQVAEYTALYNQYCIKRVVLTLIPSYNSYQSYSGTATTPSAITAPRLVYAINDSAQQPVPTSELDVLQDNGAKIRSLTRPLKISFRPVAEVGVSISTGGFVAESKRDRWLSTQDAQVLHAGVSYAIQQYMPSTANNDPMCTVYARVTFSLRDPK